MHTISRTSGTGQVRPNAFVPISRLVSRAPRLTNSRKSVRATSGFGGRWQHFPKPLNLASWVLGRLIVWQERAEQRHALAMLDDRQLEDIGLTRRDIVREIAKPFWRG